jgi:hypothetical protein
LQIVNARRRAISATSAALSFGDSFSSGSPATYTATASVNIGIVITCRMVDLL